MNTQQDTTQFDFSQVHASCPICFNEQCPSAGSCMRRMAALQAPASCQAHLCVLPHALQGDRCPLYQKMETTRVAYGMERSFDDVRRKDFVAMRKELLSYFRYKLSYYWHLRGEKPLMPEDQRWIEDLFLRYGYGGMVRYDRMEDVYVMDGIFY